MFCIFQGLTVNNVISFDSYLANNLNYYNSTNDTSDPYFYTISQTVDSQQGKSIPQLTVAIWSGLSLRCQTTGQNLACVLSLPNKFKGLIEGLMGNFNGNPSDDLFNRNTSSVVAWELGNDSAILAACLSCENNSNKWIFSFPLCYLLRSDRATIERYHTSSNVCYHAKWIHQVVLWNCINSCNYESKSWSDVCEWHFSR